MEINFGLKPFWFWNGKMDNGEIVRQLREMSDKGVGGFFIHPRQGLTVPYMSDMWFEKVGVAIEEAKKLNLEVWLYDEFPYPSGIAGGEVVNGHPELAARALNITKVDAVGGHALDIELPMGVVLAASAYPVVKGCVQWEQKRDLSSHIGIGYREKIYQESGLTFYNKKRFFGGEAGKFLHWEAPTGQWKIYVFMEVPVSHFKYFGTFIDPLNPAATDRFLMTTHEKYKMHFGSEFGKTIKGIFVDETAPFGEDIPWSPLLPELFRLRNGYDLIEFLPALVEKMGENSDQIRYDFWNTVVSTFIENFDMRIHEWCKKNNILYVGEKPILRSSQLQHMDIPGTDAGHQKAGDNPLISDGIYRHSGKVGSSAAHFYNKKMVLCEAFHSIGWSMTYQDMKWIMDWLAMTGINMFVPHGYFYTTDALAKHDAPPSPFFQMPAWKYNHSISLYMKDLLSNLASGARKVDILIMDPITSTWTAMGEKKHVKKKLFEDFGKLQDTMLRQHMDYYIIDPELLSQAEVKEGCLYVNGERYQVLVIPPAMNIDQAAMKVVKKYLGQGGITVMAGCLPVEKIDLASATASVFDKALGLDSMEIYENYIHPTEEPGKPYRIQVGNATFASAINDIPGCIKDYMSEDISIYTENMENENIMAAHYIKQDSELYFLINVSKEVYETQVKIKYDCESRPCLSSIPIGTDEACEVLDFKTENGYLYAPLKFYPFQSYMLLIDHDENRKKSIASGSKRKYCLDIQGDWDISIKSMNALRLYHWDLEVRNPKNAEFEFISASKEPVVCKPIIDQVIDGRLALPLHTRALFGCPKEILFPALRCRYKAGFAVDQPTRLWLVIEPGSIGGDWHIQLNGNMIKPEDFINRPVYLPTNLVVEISSMVKQGKNTMEVFVNTSLTYDGVVNPLYIFGNFGLAKNDSSAEYWSISKLPDRGRIGDLAGCGLPFYAGEMEYSKHLTIDGSDNGEFELLIDDPRVQNSVSLSINGHSAGVKSWSPYRWSIDNSWLDSKGNTVTLCMTTSLLGLFEGQSIDPMEHKVINL